jgi:hypothetical protein
MAPLHVGLCRAGRRALWVRQATRGHRMEDDQEPRPESLLPYEDWIETAMRQVVAQAITHIAASGLPGEHHFYLTFRTDHPGVVIPARLRAQYPQEMTIVLQHQYRDLKFDQETEVISVGLSFGGVPASLIFPLSAVIGFADPFVRYGLRFRAAEAAETTEESEAAAPPTDEPAKSDETPQVVSLDAFRRRTPTKE